jgi:asparagine synthase (glutamine-hydrolysing)
MCGITGIYHFENKKRVQEEEIKRMRETLVHRGPDGKGLFISKDGRVGLGHRRLSIIDLTEAGAQPMTNRAKDVQVVYNGEIYNFKELREELRGLGYEFQSRTDTEVIVHGYKEWGVNCVTRFNGMFSFVLWDEKKRQLFAARDHIGIKPLYYALQNGTFYFGSEIKAILAHPDFKKEFEEKNASYYMTFASLPAPYTLFKNVRKLPAAHYLIIDSNGNVTEKEYWNPLRDNEYPKNSSEEYYIKEIRNILRDAIEKQMVSDVPFGCFLSGGVDSSTNATLMSEAMGKPVETFTIAAKGYGEKYDELRYARKIVDMLGAKSHEIMVGYEDLMKFIPSYGRYFDDPNGDQITFLVYYISKLIRESGVIVAQVGEGSDEMFAGYDTSLLATNLYEKIWKYAENLPKIIKKIPYGILHPLNFAKLGFSTEYARRLAKNQEPYWGHAIAFTPTEKEGLLTKDYKNQLVKNHEYDVIEQCYDKVEKTDPEADFLEKMVYLELKIRLPELLLMRVDRMAMAHSVETRVPFLDKRLVELAIHIPQNIKLKNGETKHILKKAVEGIIPNENIYREKQGFGAPIAEWMKKKETAKSLLDIISNSKLKERNIVNYKYLDKLVNIHQSGGRDHNFRIWNILSLSLWYDEWFS